MFYFYKKKNNDFKLLIGSVYFYMQQQFVLHSSDRLVLLNILVNYVSQHYELILNTSTEML